MSHPNKGVGPYIWLQEPHLTTYTITPHTMATMIATTMFVVESWNFLIAKPMKAKANTGKKPIKKP